MNEIVTFAENLIPLISGLRDTTDKDRCVAEPTRLRPLRRRRTIHRLPSCLLFR